MAKNAVIDTIEKGRNQSTLTVDIDEHRPTAYALPLFSDAASPRWANRSPLPAVIDGRYSDACLRSLKIFVNAGTTLKRSSTIP